MRIYVLEVVLSTDLGKSLDRNNSSPRNYISSVRYRASLSRPKRGLLFNRFIEVERHLPWQVLDSRDNDNKLFAPSLAHR